MHRLVFNFLWLQLPGSGSYESFTRPGFYMLTGKINWSGNYGRNTSCFSLNHRRDASCYTGNSHKKRKIHTVSKIYTANFLDLLQGTESIVYPVLIYLFACLFINFVTDIAGAGGVVAKCYFMEATWRFQALCASCSSCFPCML